MAVRSLRLVAIRLTAPGNVVGYTVPSGFTTIVKAVEVFSRAAAPVTVIVQALRVAGGSVSVPLVYASVAPNTAQHYAVWTVLEESDQILLAGDNLVDIWVSGATLPNAP